MHSNYLKLKSRLAHSNIDSINKKLSDTIKYCEKIDDIEKDKKIIINDAIQLERKLYNYLFNEYRNIPKNYERKILRWFNRKLGDKKSKIILETNFSIFSDTDEHFKARRISNKNIKIYKEYLMNILKFSNDYKKELNSTNNEYVNEFFYSKYFEIFGDRILFDNYKKYLEIAKNINPIIKGFHILKKILSDKK